MPEPLPMAKRFQRSTHRQLRQPSAAIDHTTGLFVRHSREMERKSGSRRNCRELVGHCCLLVVCSIFLRDTASRAARKNDTRHRRFRWLNAFDVRPSETNGNRPATPDFLRHCLCGTAAKWKRKEVRRGRLYAAPITTPDLT